ncbi:MAG TPA: hypothetical protein VGH82_16085 [Gaiellaceae bacterium]
MALLDYAENHYSQFGEDGVLRRVFDVIGAGGRTCCEFGAWDGVHFSNTRALIEDGWRGVLIEADPDRYAELEAANPSPHVTVHAAVDDRDNTLVTLLEQHGVDTALDFVSIDIDGEDLYVLRSLGVRPRVICIEAMTAHDPAAPEVARELAATGVGQPLGVIAEAGRALGYRLVCFTGNAFLLRTDIQAEFPTLSPEDAWEQNIRRVGWDDRRWLYRMNLGIESPFHRFGNRCATARRLGIPPREWLPARLRQLRRLAFG